MDVEETMNTTMAEPLKVKKNKEGSDTSLLNHANPSLLSLAAQAAHPDVSGAVWVIILTE